MKAHFARRKATRPARSRWELERLENRNLLSTVGASTPGDFDGNGVTDLALVHREQAVWAMQLKNEAGETLGTRSQQFGCPECSFEKMEDIPAPGDYNGDGITDFAVFHRWTAEWEIQFKDANGVTTGTSIEQFGFPDNLAVARGYSTLQDSPVPGDYNGDGVTDLGVYRFETGEFMIKLKNAEREVIGSRVQQFGCPQYMTGNVEDLPVPADYDGNGVTDLAVYRIWTGEFMIHLKGADGVTLTDSEGKLCARVQQHGARQMDSGQPLLDIPVVGDYNGDGVADYTVFRPYDATWHTRMANADGSLIPGSARVQQCGCPELYVGQPLMDVPILSPIAGLIRRGRLMPIVRV